MNEHRIRFATPVHRTVRALLVAAVLASGPALAPQPAEASRLSTDRVGGVRVSSSRIATSTAPDIDARSGILVAGDGRVLWSRGPRTARPMASTTKLMTALVVLERCNLDQQVTVTRAAARTPYALGLRPGEKHSVRTLLRLAVVASSNDAAVALAIHTAGSQKRFVRMMNRRAGELGLSNTRFVNPHGLDARGHYSSAKDLAALTRVLMRWTEFRRMTRKRSVVLPAYGSRPARRVKATNHMLGTLEGLRGGKTGFTNDARYCLTTDARRNGLTLNSVVLGSPGSKARFRSSRRLLEWGFKHYRMRQLCTTGTPVGTATVAGSETPTVAAQAAATTSAQVLGPLGPVTRSVTWHEGLAAPIQTGQELGVVRFIQGSSVIATVAAVAANPVAPLP